MRPCASLAAEAARFRLVCFRKQHQRVSLRPPSPALLFQAVVFSASHFHLAATRFARPLQYCYGALFTRRLASATPTPPTALWVATDAALLYEPDETLAHWAALAAAAQARANECVALAEAAEAKARVAHEAWINAERREEQAREMAALEAALERQIAAETAALDAEAEAEPMPDTHWEPAPGARRVFHATP